MPPPPPSTADDPENHRLKLEATRRLRAQQDYVRRAELEVQAYSHQRDRDADAE